MNQIFFISKKGSVKMLQLMPQKYFAKYTELKKRAQGMLKKGPF